MRAKAIITHTITPYLSENSISFLKLEIKEGESVEVEVIGTQKMELPLEKGHFGDTCTKCRMLEGPYEGYTALFGSKHFIIEPSTIVEEDMLEGHLYPGHEIED